MCPGPWEPALAAAGEWGLTRLDGDPEHVGADGGEGQRDRLRGLRVVEPHGYHGRWLARGQPQAPGHRGRRQLHLEMQCARPAGRDQVGPLLPGLIRTLYASVADLIVVPMQDLLGLGSEARMNRPGTVGGNWRWRLDWAEVPDDLATGLAAAAARYGRAPRAA